MMHHKISCFEYMFTSVSLCFLFSLGEELLCTKERDQLHHDDDDQRCRRYKAYIESGRVGSDEFVDFVSPLEHRESWHLQSARVRMGSSRSKGSVRTALMPTSIETSGTASTSTL